MQKYPQIRQSNLVVQNLEKEVLIYDLNIDKAYCLNETASLIWQLCDGKHSVADISKELNRKSQSLIPEDIVWLALDGMKKSDLLENTQFEINFNGSTRRQIIRQVGLASMIALPMIASVIAPTSLAAQSGGSTTLLNACRATSECSANETCRSCSGGSCSGSGRCCVSTVTTTSASGPGARLGGCITNCTTTAAATRCCSGRAESTPNPVCPNPATQTSCTCL